jgi:hypothetical protein
MFMHDTKVNVRPYPFWMDIHREELMADWKLACAGEEPFGIAPLQ